MIGISALYCDTENEGDAIRYGKQSRGMKARPNAHAVPKSASERRPVTAWNITRTCNLKCVHCYSDSEEKAYEGELTTDEGKNLITDLKEFKIPALLFSGGEPLVRKDIWELAGHAKKVGLRLTLSTNGVLIDEKTARRIKELGFTYVGISLDGIGEVNDRFRGKEGAFKKAMRGFKNCVAVDQRVGLRMTLTRHNFENLHSIFDFIERENIQRACFYHLVYSGRAENISGEDLTHEETRNAMDIIMDRTEDLHKRGLSKDILTVDNHVDGPYMYLKLLEKNEAKAQKVKEMLEWNGGGRYSSGVSFGDIDFLGNVHADQFWMHHTLGNVRERRFSEIWLDESDPVMNILKNRLDHLKGKCTKCKFLMMCGGALRVRADLVYGDATAPDPACYLTDEECGISRADRDELKAKGEDFPVPEHLLEKSSAV
ncbi:MAG TPA: radical SAM protein [Nitrospirae bacterium]|nr:radical SAM protein [Nitrospirota bacterium]